MTENVLSSPVEEAGEKARRMGTGQIAVWVIVGGLLIFLAVGLMQAFATQPDSGMAPDFTLETYDHGTITLSELRGKVVLINFWASWCVPCAEEAPALEAAWEEYRDKDVVFIGVGYVDSDQKAKEFIERFGVTYPNGPDLGTKISDAYRIRGVPETFIVNAEGQIVFFAQAPLTYEKIVSEIEKAKASTK